MRFRNIFRNVKTELKSKVFRRSLCQKIKGKNLLNLTFVKEYLHELKDEKSKNSDYRFL